jgi:hypothetical protein
MPKGVHTGLFDDSGLFHCQAEGLLHGTVAQWCAFQPAIEKVCLWFAALDVLLQALGDVPVYLIKVYDKLNEQYEP